MKKLIVTTFNFKPFIFALGMLLTLSLFAQWQPDVRLTYVPSPHGSYTSKSWNITSSSGPSVIHVVWTDSRDENHEIYYKHSTDLGITWSEDTRLTNNGHWSDNPGVAVFGSNVHVVWRDSRDGLSEIYYKRSVDGGLSWGPDIRLTFAGDSWYPSVAVSGMVVNVVWRDDRDGNYEIYYKRSTDNGVSWGVDTRMTNHPAGSDNAVMAVSGSVVHLIWEDAFDGNPDVFYKRSTDWGASWSATINLTNHGASQVTPSIAVSGSVVHVVWEDHRGPENYEIYYRNSSDGGLSWGSVTRVTYSIPWTGAYRPSLAVSGSNLHVVYMSAQHGNDEIYYKVSADAGANWGPEIRLTNSHGNSRKPSVAVADTGVHIVWQDDRDGYNYQLYYKRNPSGNTINWGLLNSGHSGGISSIQFLNENTGWALGSNDTILKSTNGGINWIVQRTGTGDFSYSTSFNAMYFTNLSTGYICGSGGSIMKSTNGGGNWSALTSGTSQNLLCMDFINSNTGFTAGESGIIIMTTNGGLNWSVLNSGIANTINSIKFVDQNTGFAAGISGRIIKTTNGGVNWTVLTTGDTNTINSLDATSPSVIYAAGNNGRILKTTNSGTNWMLLNTGSSSGLKSIKFINGNIGYAAGFNGALLYTTNNGDSWNVEPGIPDRNYSAMSFYGNFGWITGSAGTIVRTTNSGGTIGITKTGNELPERFSLSQNYPNPFNPITTIRFDLPKSSFVRLSVYDVTGREIEVLANEILSAGRYQLKWDASRYSSGVYFYRLITDGFVKTNKMMLIK